MEYIDLGLPSGTLWGQCNIGSTNPYEYGELYSFSEALDLEYDIPSHSQLSELTTLCERKWCSINGVNGCVFIGPNGNQIFLPASGRIEINGEHKGEGVNGFYWSNENGGIDPDNMAWQIMICDSFAMDGCQNIKRKHSVRPVRYCRKNHFRLPLDIPY